MFTVKVRNEQAARSLLTDIRNRAPFAVATACNAIANGVQSEVRKSLSANFTLRRKLFIEQSIYRNRATDFAKKGQRLIQAIVRVNPERDYLAKFEDGEQKKPVNGLHVAIPLPKVRPSFGMIVKDRDRLPALRGIPSVRKITTQAGTFIVRDVKGRGKAFRGARTDFLYKLQRSVPIRPRLGMVKTFENVVDDKAVPEMLAAMDKALFQSLRGL